MTSLFTFGAAGSNPRALDYARKAAMNSKVGSKNFVQTPFWDDRMPLPRHQARQHDNPVKDFLGWVRYRWIFHDFRLFGFRGFFRKHYYIGEAWRRKDEKIFVGKDENGNKYWFARRSKGAQNTRLVEPVDPHWFRGQDGHCAPPMWQKWLNGNLAHSPAQMKARGEYGHNSRMGQPLPYTIKHAPYAMPMGAGVSREPSWVPYSGHLVHPEHKAMREVGWTRWERSKNNPQYMPFCGVHEYSDEVMEEYYRGTWAFGRLNKGNDHDEWKA
mmetsp:Transcript_880/g.954  ORF Transcript_880/g.954 Transcript_880/m.954 type:complete len:271 (+) Transcript_880:19-831(+)